MKHNAPIVLFAGRPDHRKAWSNSLRAAAALAGLALDLRMSPEEVAPEEVDYLLYAPVGPIADIAPYVNLKAIINLWAGVETVLANPTLPAHVPLTRMVESGMTEGMTEYVVAHVMRYHLDIDGTLTRSAAGIWTEIIPPLARERRVGVLGLGALGRNAAEHLRDLHFDVAGWSRTAKNIPGVECHFGPDGLSHLLARSEIFVLLIPHTPQTEKLINAGALALMPVGARLINPARGALIDDDALLGALDSGRLAHATLDAFRSEPLPADHPFRAHPRITVTPHVASATRHIAASQAAIAQILRAERGEPLENIVDRTEGY